MGTKEILYDIIQEFNTEKLVHLFRDKTRTFRLVEQGLDYYNDDNFSDCEHYGEFKLENDLEMAVFTAHVKKELSERSGKKAQYALGKKFLKDAQRYIGGFFIFYDDKDDFRFSLIYDIPLATGRRDWSNFRRYTYFVSKEQPNKTFINQFTEADFSTLEKIIDAFSVEKVTKEFYTEIANWYFWAMDNVKFPDDYRYASDPSKDCEIRQATSLIRLITRIIFIWFLKEKKLVPDILFDQEKLAKMLKNFYRDDQSHDYYNAILQNLFFGTLNQQMNERNFAEESGYPANKKEYGVKTIYRYAEKFSISKEQILNLFKDVPFLNGGLFDCLDKEDEWGKVIYIDGFSRNPQKQAIVPDYLFFQQKTETVDLSQYQLGTNKTVRGLIEILKNYNFTIDENTPIDQEVALDPELLGKIFENLLASYNPETATTARKATGSYYTPREIVDYMVEESLVQYLEKHTHVSRENIRKLISYSEEMPKLTDEEKQKLVSAIDNIKILDPACGSGAFPMGILHKLVFALQKLDPQNKYWHELQFQKALKESEEAFRQGDKKQREERLKEINETFDESINYPDYARKLYLIENCIYGIDIQPIAIQIAKLRFFISLVLDQKVDKSKENYGIRSLPNLETKFVAANTLIALDKPLQLKIRNQQIENLENQLKKLRHKYFTATTRQEKINLQKIDKELLSEIANLLKNDGWSTTVAHQIVVFDPYNQNASADWFDPEWMFGITDGFDIVIGNPPYIQLQKAINNTSKLKYADLYKNQNYKTFDRTGDIYCLFYEKGINLLKDNGLLCFITSNKWMRAGYGEKLRSYFIQYNPLLLIDLGPGLSCGLGLPGKSVRFKLSYDSFNPTGGCLYFHKWL